MKTQCPECTQSIEADDQWAGMTVTCPTCEKGFILPNLSIQPESAAAGESAPPPVIVARKPDQETRSKAFQIPYISLRTGILLSALATYLLVFLGRDDALMFVCPCMIVYVLVSRWTKIKALISTTRVVSPQGKLLFTLGLLAACVLWVLHEVHSANERAMERIRQEQEYQAQLEKQRYEHESSLEAQKAVQGAVGTLIQGVMRENLQQQQQELERQRQLERQYGPRY